MELTTKCPQCQSVFAASLEQLQLRKGYVRCVKCAHIFDGYEAVVPGANNEPKPESEPKRYPDTSNQNINTSASIVPNVVRHRSYKPDNVTAHTISDLQEPSGSDDLSTDPFTISDFDHKSEPKQHKDQIQTAELSKPLPGHPVQAESEPYIDHRGTIALAAWVVLIAVGVAVLLLQLLFVFRVQVAEAVPAARPRLERMCNVLGCSVAWARKPQLITVVYSSLQSSPEQQTENNEEHVILQVRLRNSYSKPQEWPTLVLELTDAAGARIARKNIAANEYLTPALAANPFPAGTEHNINLPLTLHGLKVNGYQLTTFFP